MMNLLFFVCHEIILELSSYQLPSGSQTIISEISKLTNGNCRVSLKIKHYS